MTRSASRFGWVRNLVSVGLVGACLVALGSTAKAQYIGLGLPFNNVSEASYERMGVGFNFWRNGAPNGRGVVGLLPNGQLAPDGRIRFTQGSFGGAIPPFGGYDPNADAHLGFAYNGSGGGFALNLALGKGSTRTATNVTPSIVVPNGIPGSVFSGQLSPFVTGIVPVVGGVPASYYTTPAQPAYWISPVEYKLWQLQQQAAAGDLSTDDEGLVLSGGSAGASEQPVRTFSDPESSASRPSLSVEELTRQRQEQQQAEERERVAKIDELVERAEQAVAEKFYGAARENLRRALRLATPNEREALQVKLESVPRR